MYLSVAENRPDIWDVTHMEFNMVENVESEVKEKIESNRSDGEHALIYGDNFVEIIFLRLGNVTVRYRVSADYFSSG